MKPFKINRDSWHYRLNMSFANTWGSSSYGRELWENNHRDFCSYWRATSFRVLLASLLAAMLSMLVFVLGVTIYQDPITFVAVTISAIIIVIAIFGLGFLLNYTAQHIANRSGSVREPKPEGLIAQRYRAYKSRVCPMVEYDK